MADTTGLGGTTLHYLAVYNKLWLAYTDLYKKKITPTFLLTQQTDPALYTPENGFQGAIKCQGSSFLCFAPVFLLEKTTGTGLY